MLKQHPLSALYPAMPEQDFDGLVADIRQHGQKEAVIVFQGQILDGWHRYQACAKVGIKCVTTKHDGTDPLAFVMSRNLHRRHLTGSQRAAIAVAAAEWQEGAGRPKNNPEPGSGFSTEAQMAAAAEVTDRTIRQAKVAHEAGLGPAVRDGKISAKHPKRRQDLSLRNRATTASRNWKPLSRKPRSSATMPPILRAS
jgi:hypothetical protein